MPYRGEAPALIDLLGGHVQVVFGTMPASVEYVKAGRLRALAVTTAARSDVLPDIPSLGEFVPNYESSVWTGLGAPNDHACVVALVTLTSILDRLCCARQ
jgi:tripartite-type tricarboxylate transporter receptor subunit TctC